MPRWKASICSGTTKSATRAPRPDGGSAWSAERFSGSRPWLTSTWLRRSCSQIETRQPPESSTNVPGLDSLAFSMSRPTWPAPTTPLAGLSTCSPLPGWVPSNGVARSNIVASLLLFLSFSRSIHFGGPRFQLALPRAQLSCQSVSPPCFMHTPTGDVSYAHGLRGLRGLQGSDSQLGEGGGVRKRNKWARRFLGQPFGPWPGS